MQQTKKMVLFGLWFLGFFLVMHKLVAPMTGQDPVVVEATPAPVLGAATVAAPNQSTTQPNGVRQVKPHLSPTPSTKPGTSVQPTLTPAPPTVQPAATPASSPEVRPSPTPTPSLAPTATPTPSPSPTHAPIFSPFPPIHIP